MGIFDSIAKPFKNIGKPFKDIVKPLAPIVNLGAAVAKPVGGLIEKVASSGVDAGIRVLDTGVNVTESLGKGVSSHIETTSNMYKGLGETSNRFANSAADIVQGFGQLFSGPLGWIMIIFVFLIVLKVASDAGLVKKLVEKV